MKICKASKLILFLLVCSYTSVTAQTISIGTELGGGIISSNSPKIGSFFSVLFIEGGLSSENYIGYRLSMFYAGDFTGLLPGDKSDYYPFIKGASVKFIHSSSLSDRFFFEQGLGILALNDHVFSDRNKWGYGLTVSLTAGKDFRSQDYSGISAGVSTEYGLTFTEFSANFLSFSVQLKYSL